MQHTLYFDPLCPFCVRVLGFLKAKNTEIPMIDVYSDPSAFNELRSATGRSTVPCLKIVANDGGEHWMHESTDIIEYLSVVL